MQHSTLLALRQSKAVIMLVSDAVAECHCADIVVIAEHVHAFTIFHQYPMQSIQPYLNFWGP